MTAENAFSPTMLELNVGEEADRIATSIRQIIFHDLRRKGAVLGLSGGVDSSVTAALLVRAVGRERVLGLLMPESDTSDETLRLSNLVAGALGIKTLVEDITPTLTSAGCYARRDEAIRRLIPAYQPDWKCKIILPGILEKQVYPVFSLVVRPPAGDETKVRLTAEAYLAIVAATNFKQRTRKMMEYYHADRLQYAVVGTPNRLEYDQGFFVKNGDGAADLKPIAHLYKSQVYQLATYLGIPEEIRKRPPTTETYSLEQTQEEFYFSLPLEKMDLCLFARNHGFPPEEVAPVVGLTPEQVVRVYQQIDARRHATRYLHAKPVLIENVSEVGS